MICLSLLPSCTAMGSARAEAAVSCPRQKLQSAIDLAPPGQVTEIAFTGTCSENLIVPYGKSVALVGVNPSATIVPKDMEEPAINSLGVTEIRLATVATSGPSARLVQAAAGGRISILASTLRSGTASVLLGVTGGSYASIVNSELRGGAGASVEMSEDSTVVALSDSGALRHRVNGRRLVIRNVSPGILFSCSTSTLQVSVLGNSSVLLSGGGAAVIPSQCRIGIYNGDTPSSNVELSNFSGSALGGSMSTYDIQGLTIRNSQYGILAHATSFQIGSAIFSGNRLSDIMVGGTSTVSIPGYGGYQRTQFTDAVKGVGKFNCSSGARIDINQAAVVQGLGNSASDCVTVY